MRLLSEIKEGNLPTVAVKNVVLQKNETPYWLEPASLYEERVVRRRYEGGSHGVSIRIAKGLSYRVGAQRGQMVSDTAAVPVSTGSLIVTNRRVIFQGDRKSFSFRLDKLLELECYQDGIRLTDDKGKPRLVKFDDGSTEVFAAVLSHAINHFAA